jgi:hypothetical protein
VIIGALIVLALIAIVALLIAMPATVLTVWAWPIIVVLTPLLLGRIYCRRARTTTDCPGRFIRSRRARRACASYFAFLDMYHVLSPEMLRVYAWLRIIPTEDLASWPCRICGEPEASLKHGFPGPLVELTTLEAAASKRPRRSVGTPGEATRVGSITVTCCARALALGFRRAACLRCAALASARCPSASEGAIRPHAVARGCA